MNYYIIEPKTKARLCKDGLFRISACFGTFPETVKVWISEAWERKKQNKLYNQGNVVSVVTLARDGTIFATDECFPKK